MAQLLEVPTDEQLTVLIGEVRLAAWKRFCAEIEARYETERLWSDGGKRWTYEYKYRRGGKTLCALYAKPDGFGLMLIFGRDERARVEAIRAELSAQTLATYDAATVYHDGKWVMFDETLPIPDLVRLLQIKRRPNKR